MTVISNISYRELNPPNIGRLKDTEKEEKVNGKLNEELKRKTKKDNTLSYSDNSNNSFILNNK